jgi:mono/diheme cytochrome c family protein
MQEPALAVDPELRRRIARKESIVSGEKLIRRYGCFGCHTINGMEAESRVSVELTTFGAKHLEELFFGDRLDLSPTWDDWTINKLLTPRTYATARIEQAMPEFGFDPADARALTVFLSSRTGHAVNPKYRPGHADMEPMLKKGREVVGYYNCWGCHSFDGKEGAIRRYYQGPDAENAPPILVKEGIKLQPEWFFDFLKRPMRLRPWLKVRMPTFDLSDEETSAVVDYFAALDGYHLGPVVLEARAEANAPRVPTHAASPDAPVDCGACHLGAGAKIEDTHYSVSRKQLTAGDIDAWLAAHGAGGSDTTETGDPAGALADFIGAGTN